MVTLIGINGRIGSGKDTIGEIIQELTKKEIQGYCSINEGKIEPALGGSEWQIKKFAGKLKQIASILTGIPVHWFESQVFKKTALGEEWNKVSRIKGFANGKDADVIILMTVRDLLQKLGTEAMRNGLHTNVWVNALFADYKAPMAVDAHEAENYEDSNFQPNCPKWIITDLRFPNEFDAIKERGGITIQVLRDGTKKEGEHISETALDNHKFDYTIHNGTMEGLIASVKKILQRENII